MGEGGRQELISLLRILIDNDAFVSTDQFRLPQIGAVDTDMRGDLLLSFCLPSVLQLLSYAFVL